MAEDRPVSTVNSDYATPAQSPVLLDSAILEPPRASFFNPGLSPDLGTTPRDSIAPSASGPEQDTPAESTTFLPAGKESGAVSLQGAVATKPLYRRSAFLAAAIAALVAIILIIILPVYFVVIHKNNDSSNIASGNGNTTGNGNGPGHGKNPPTSSSATTGGDGSTIVSGNTSFIYHNAFGGFCEFSLALQHPWVFFFWVPCHHIMHRSCLFLTLCSCFCFSVCFRWLALDRRSCGTVKTRRNNIFFPALLSF
jgi:hypothetical protein